MLSILIVNYRTPQLTVNCIRSVYEYTGYIDFEIIVIDNDSGDNSVEIIQNSIHDLQTHFLSKVRLEALPSNVGFARANNFAMSIAKGDTFLLLNSDTLVHDNAIGNSYTDFKSSGYGACGVQLLNADGSPQISGNYFMKGSINFWLAIPYIGKLLKFAGELASVKKPNVPDSDAPVEVDWINGAFLMVKKEVVERVGRMDEDFFLYAEETEWCYRIGKQFKLCIYGQYKVTHLVGASSGTAFNSEGGYANIFDKKGLQYLLSNFLRIYKQHGKAWYVLHLMVYTFSVPIVYLGALFSISNRKEKLKQAGGLAKNVRAIWNYTPTIFKGEPYFYKVL